jgi:hypothetical protein
MAGKFSDLILVYQFIKRLTTPFNKTEAFKLGIIDERGKKLKSPETKAEKNSYGYYDRMIFNLKKLLEKAPGGKSAIASYAAALFLIKESDTSKEFTEEEMIQGLYEAMSELESKKDKEFKNLFEDAPANVTGTGVVGTGDDPVHWAKPDARRKEFKAFLRRYLDQKQKRKKIKERKDFLKRFGL